MRNLKKTLGLLASILIGLDGFGQWQFIKEYSLDFYGGANTEYEDYSQHVDKQSNNFIIGGPVEFTPGVSDPALIKVDSYGNLTGVAKRYHLGGNQRGVHTVSIEPAATITDAGQLQVGINDAYSSNFMIKTNLAGNVVWKKNFTLTNEFGEASGIKVTGVKYASNKQVYICGLLGNQPGHHNNQGVNLAILKVNPTTGAINWYRVYSISGFTNLFAYGIDETTPGKMVVFGGSTLHDRGFLLSFSENSSGLPTALVAKRVRIHSGGFTSNSKITAIKYHEGSLIIGGNTYNNQSGQKNIFLFRVNNYLNSPTSMSGVAGYTTNYLAPNFPHLTDIASNGTNLALSGTTNQFGYYRSFVIPIGNNGVVINNRMSTLNQISSQTGVNLFKNGTGYAALTHGSGVSKKIRFTNYNALGYTCSDVPIPSSYPYNELVTIETASITQIASTKTESVPSITTSSITVSTTVICESCNALTFLQPITTSTGSTILCDGTTLTLNAPAGYVYYQWLHNGNPVGNSSTLTISEGGNYTVLMLTSEGCQSQSSITITEYNHCFATAPGNIDYCILPSNVVPWVGWTSNPLSGCPGSYSFSWEYEGNPVGLTNYKIPFQGDGNYTVTVVSPCTTQVFNIVVTNLLTTYINQTIATPTLHSISLGVPTFKALYTPPAGWLYNWKIENMSTSAIQTGNSSTITATGYTIGDVLQVTLKFLDVANCKTYENSWTFIDAPGRNHESNSNTMETNEKENMEVRIFPNPGNGIFNVELSGYETSEEIPVLIFNSMGSLVMQTTIDKENIKLDLNHLENGIYLINISRGTEVKTLRISKTN